MTVKGRVISKSETMQEGAYTGSISFKLSGASGYIVKGEFTINFGSAAILQKFQIGNEYAIEISEQAMAPKPNPFL